MATGDATDLLERVKRLIPFRWFQWAAPLRDAIVGGLSDCAAKGYSFILYTRQQSRLATATGIWLDILCYDFLRRHLLRRGTSDTVFRNTIQATILQERVTRKGMNAALTALLNIPPFIFEPWSTNDAGAYNTGNFAYGMAGGWGSLQLPGQVFIKVSRVGIGPSGVPNVAGWFRGQGSIGVGGYGQGAIEYVSGVTPTIGVTDADIYQIIANTKPTGVTCWVQIGTEFVIGQAPAIIPQGGIGPFLPLIQSETQPHFIAQFRPVKLFVSPLLRHMHGDEDTLVGPGTLQAWLEVQPHFVGSYRPSSYTPRLPQRMN
jgi:hypothetical protein